MKIIPARIKVYITDKKGNLIKMLFDKKATDTNIFKALQIYYKKSESI